MAHVLRLYPANFKPWQHRWHLHCQKCTPHGCFKVKYQGMSRNLCLRRGINLPENVGIVVSNRASNVPVYRRTLRTKASKCLICSACSSRPIALPHRIPFFSRKGQTNIRGNLRCLATKTKHFWFSAASLSQPSLQILRGVAFCVHR